MTANEEAGDEDCSDNQEDNFYFLVHPNIIAILAVEVGGYLTLTHIGFVKAKGVASREREETTGAMEREPDAMTTNQVSRVIA